MNLRKNQASLSPSEKAAFVHAVRTLKSNGTYDVFVRQHLDAMRDVKTDPAHFGPAFLPWHREYLRRFELELQKVNPNVTLPYWDWTVDRSPAASLWADTFMGGNGVGPDRKVETGPFAYDTGGWTLHVRDPDEDRPFLRRSFGSGGDLPKADQVTGTLGQTPYDAYPWNVKTSSHASFRARLERGIHHHGHVWVGETMLSMSSPNDPVFWLHHCNIDRLWAIWQRMHPGEPYLPPTGDPDVLKGHALDDAMPPWDKEGSPPTPRSVLDHLLLCYTYDADPVPFPWSYVGNTSAFGQVTDGRSIWTGDFTGEGRHDVLFFQSGDRAWWRGRLSGGKLTWTHVGKSTSSHDVAAGRPTWIADLTGDGRDDILVHRPDGRDWLLGRLDSATLTWGNLGSTAGFGNLADGRPIWVADFTGDGHADVLFYFPGDHKWWLGHLGQLPSENPGCAAIRSGIAKRNTTIDNLKAQLERLDPGNPNDRRKRLLINARISELNHEIIDLQKDFKTFACPTPARPNPVPGLVWGNVGNTAGFGNLGDGRPIWTADFTGDGRADVLFYFPGDGNWWLGRLDGGQLKWSLVGNTAGFGNLADGRPIWVADFAGDGRADVLFYFPGDGNWWLGRLDTGKLDWTLVGNTAYFGDIGDGRPIWAADFTGEGRADILFYYPGDENWWLGRVDDGAHLWWRRISNTCGFGNVADGRPIWIGDFTGEGRAGVLFYAPGDRNWWLGRLA